MIFIKAPELFLFSCRPFFEKLPSFFSALEIDDETGIDLSSGQVVGNSELVLIGSRNPVVGVDILHVHQVENIHPQPNTFDISQESAVANDVLFRDQLVRETDVDTFVSRRAEEAILISFVGDRDGKPTGQDPFQIQFDTFVAGEVVLKEKAQVIPRAVG